MKCFPSYRRIVPYRKYLGFGLIPPWKSLCFYSEAVGWRADLEPSEVLCHKMHCSKQELFNGTSVLLHSSGGFLGSLCKRTSQWNSRNGGLPFASGTEMSWAHPCGDASVLAQGCPLKNELSRQSSSEALLQCIWCLLAFPLSGLTAVFHAFQCIQTHVQVRDPLNGRSSSTAKPSPCSPDRPATILKVTVTSS